MSRPVHNADFEKYESKNPERVDEGSPSGMSKGHEGYMEEVFCDPLLDVIAGLDSGETPRGEDSRTYIAEYLRKYHLLGTVECGNCGRVNYEGEERCSLCGTSLRKPLKVKNHAAL